MPSELESPLRPVGSGLISDEADKLTFEDSKPELLYHLQCLRICITGLSILLYNTSAEIVHYGLIGLLLALVLD